MALARLLFRVLLILLILLVVIGLMLPSKALVERRIEIDASPETIFSQINNLRNFHAWSPWTAMDPDTHYGFEGPQAGVGARMLWSSSQTDAGDGSMEIVRSEPPREVEARLNFGGKGHGIATFLLAPQTNGHTTVTWRFETDFGWDLFGRYLGLMFDGMIGITYAKGLQTLKQRVEAM
jgi:hypothetical protein